MDNVSLEGNTDTRGNNEFITKYHSINNKLKKRFLRNPNISEACEQFSALALQCEQEEAWQYAGLCTTSVAHCYHTLGNTDEEVNNFLKAGRYYLTAHRQNKSIGCPSVGQENLQAAHSCFNQAVAACENHPELSAVAAGALAELALAMGPTPAGGELLKKSIKIFPTTQAMDLLLSYYIKQTDFTSALNFCIEFIDSIESSAGPNLSGYNKILLRKLEVKRLFLLLIEQPPAQRLSPVLAEVLEKFTTEEDIWNGNFHMCEEEFILLQSLTLACQSKDNEAILEVEDALWKFLNAEEKNLLRILSLLAFQNVFSTSAVLKNKLKLQKKST